MIFKRNKNYIFYRIAFSHFFTIIILLQNHKNYYAILIVWFITVVLTNFVLSFMKNLKAIEIKDQSIYLHFNKYFKEATEIYDLSDLNFTYKIETGGKGSRSYAFRIYKNGIDRSIASMEGIILDGWEDDTIFDIIYELKELGIEVKE